MTAVYELRILTAAGVELHRLAQNPGGQDPTKVGFTELAYVNQVNGIGGCAFLLPALHSVIPDLTERCQVEVWRSDPDNGVVNARDWSGFFLDEERWYENGQWWFKALCYSDMFMISDRYILWRADTASKSAFVSNSAEGIMKTLVRYNCCSDATVANGRIAEGAITGVTYEAIAGLGSTLSLKCAWDSLLATLQKVASIGGGDFDLIKTGAQAWEFRWYTGQRGTDRTATLIFSTDLGNMANPKYSKVRSSKKTSVVVGGQGTGADRAVEPRTGNGYTATLNFEDFYNGSGQVETAAGLEAAGDAQLAELKDKEDFSFDVLQTPNCVYSKDYFLGDKATARFLEREVAVKIIGIKVALAKNGQDTITPVMEVV